MNEEDFEEQELMVWPDNWQAVILFTRLRTQWRVGFGGAVGLDYNVLYRMIGRLKLDDIEAEELEEDVQVMELEALRVMAEAASQ
ncbi:DUF1799 domain-containing protein [Chromobacterium haemolyticum]|uniref:DUF1799 domain-containing protein n=1 Tax=Chromobacterium haemolyticum TaxID=394935 RepID=UPI004057C66B